MYFIIEGSAKVIIKSQDPCKPNLEIPKKKGEYFGEIALIIDSKRTGTRPAVLPSDPALLSALPPALHPRLPLP